MFNKKFNPDVTPNYNKYIQTWDNNKYQLKNTPYKLITGDKTPVIKNIEDLQIKNNIDNKDIQNKYSNILNDRNIKQKKLNQKNKDEIKKKLSLQNTKLFDNNEDITDFEDLKDNYISDFKEKEEEIKKDRNKFNKMLESLLEDGFLE